MKHYFLSAALLAIVAICDAQYIHANRKLSNLLNNTAINASLVPMNTGKLNLGSGYKQWNNFYLSGSVYKGGSRFLSSDTLGNIFLGIVSGINSTGYGNTAIGDSAMYSNTIGTENTATGYRALYHNIDGGSNTAYGYQALYNNNGFGNHGFGGAALYSNTTGFFNVTSGGYGALFNNTEGYLNVACGAFALVRNTTGFGNTAFGESALWTNETNNLNTAIGKEAGGGLDYSNATFLGAFASSDSGLSNITAVGYEAKATASNQVMVGNTSVTSIGGYANWSNFSDGRYKRNIKEDVPGLEFITQLRPVTYTIDVDGVEKTKKNGLQSMLNIPGFGRMPSQANALRNADKQQSPEQLKAKQEKAKVVYTGFIAQDVEKAAKKLNYNFSGVDAPKTEKGFYALRYGDFIMPLVKAVQQQQQQIEEQQKQIEELKVLIQTTTKQPASNTNLSAASLKQNAPNPFNKNTVIDYYIPDDAGIAQIIVTDMKGNSIRTFNATKGKGQINIHSNELPAATYNYTLLINGKNIETRQMIITR